MIYAQNTLMKNLPSEIMENCELVELRFGESIYETQKPIDYVYFPVSGFISLVLKLGDHHPLELCLIGTEGMLGATLALGAELSPMSALVQGAGNALRMSKKEFHYSLNYFPLLHKNVHYYLYIVLRQLALTAACTHFHAIEPRLARWLLMSHDRAHADHFHLTQEFVAGMLGVRRSGITLAAGLLQQKKLIHYSRGEITVINRLGLEAEACSCYRTVKRDFDYDYSEVV